LSYEPGLCFYILLLIAVRLTRESVEHVGDWRIDVSCWLCVL